MSSTPLVTTPRLPGAETGRVRLHRFNEPESRVLLVGAAVAVALLVLMFWANIAHFVYIWSIDENYSHGFLVPLISLYFANEAYKRGPIAHAPGVGLGIPLVVAAILGRLATVVVPVGFVGDLSLLLGLAGVVSILLGRAALWRFGFAIAFLAFMIPLPVALYAKIASPLQLMVSQFASVLLNVIGIPALCEGNMITLPGDNRLFVAEACSGMRQLTGFLALTTAWAYLVKRPVWYRVVLVLSAIPIAMTANIVRVTLTGVVSHYFDPKYASGAFHTAEGLLMMGFGLCMLYAGCWVLDRLAGVSTDMPGDDSAAPTTAASGA